MGMEGPCPRREGSTHLFMSVWKDTRHSPNQQFPPRYGVIIAPYVSLQRSTAQLFHGDFGWFLQEGKGIKERPHSTDRQQRSLCIHVPPCFKENFKLLTMLEHSRLNYPVPEEEK